MDRRQLGRGQVLRLVIQGGQHPLPLEPPPVVGQGDLRPLAQEGPGQLQRQREPAQHPGDDAGILMLGMGRVEEGLAGGVSEEEVEGRGLGQHGDLDGGEPAQVPPPGREQHPAAQTADRPASHHRPDHQRRVGKVVQDQQSVRLLG